jgi:hypothetical protein
MRLLEPEVHNGKRRPAGAFSDSVVLDSDCATTTLGKPTLAKPTPIILGITTPDAGLLIGFECVLKTIFLHEAGGADGDGRIDLVDGGAGGANREEQAGLRVPAGGQVSPVRGNGCKHESSSLCDLFHKGSRPKKPRAGGIPA